MTERLPFDFSLSCIGEGNGNPLQCSCLENPRDGGSWWAAIYRVAQSWTRLKRLSSSSSLGFLGFPVAQLVKNPPATLETWVDPWVGKIHWRRARQLTPVFLSGKSHGQRSLVDYSPWDSKRVGYNFTTEEHQTFLNL